MTQEKVFQTVALYFLDGIDWSSTPLYNDWDNGDFPDDCDNEDDFEKACEELEQKHKPSDENLTLWQQVFLIVTQPQKV